MNSSFVKDCFLSFCSFYLEISESGLDGAGRMMQLAIYTISERINHETTLLNRKLTLAIWQWHSQCEQWLLVYSSEVRSVTCREAALCRLMFIVLSLGVNWGYRPGLPVPWLLQGESQSLNVYILCFRLILYNTGSRLWHFYCSVVRQKGNIQKIYLHLGAKPNFLKWTFFSSQSIYTALYCYCSYLKRLYLRLFVKINLIAQLLKEIH